MIIQRKYTYGDGRVEYVEEEVIDEQATYTEEQLTLMSNAELQAILASMGISATMNKTNMVRLILGMQAENQ